jgi:hypothetical protein
LVLVLVLGLDLDIIGMDQDCLSNHDLLISISLTKLAGMQAQLSCLGIFFRAKKKRKKKERHLVLIVRLSDSRPIFILRSS